MYLTSKSVDGKPPYVIRTESVEADYFEEYFKQKVILLAAAGV